LYQLTKSKDKNRFHLRVICYRVKKHIVLQFVTTDHNLLLNLSKHFGMLL